MERRKSPRKMEDTLVRFDGENFSIYSRATNVSAGGAFVATHYLLDPGTRISVHLIDPSGGEDVRMARVIRSESRTDERGEAQVGLGVEFLA